MSNYTETKCDSVKAEYSLTKHLNLICSQDEKYKDLYAVWTLDQEIYSKALTTVALNFPHYSMHDSSHSSSIINKIEMLLGEERIKSMSPTDTFMILESAYLHDFGMIIANAELVEQWGTPRFQRFLKSLKDSIHDEELANAADFLLNIQNKKMDFEENNKWAVDVRNCVTLISAEYFRKKHSIRSANWIENPKRLGIDINFNNLIPERIMRLIGKVAISHGTDFESVFCSLEHIDNGMGTDRIHPRFIACMLRLGDLLDLDNGRFNPVMENVSKFPKSSDVHKRKHGSVTHFLVCPEKIEVSAVCKDDEVYRVTREWFDYLKEELKNLSSRWSEIVPHKFSGGPPSLGDIKLSIENAQQITEQLDLRFSIDQERAFELIEGSGIYDSELIFIRELLQNALDATKMQMWKDIRSKKYDYIRIVNCADRKISEEKDKLFFYDDIPEEIRNLYPINIEVIYKEPKKVKEEGCQYEKEAEYIFRIEDRGCGISINDLKRMENVGGSWKQDDELQDFIDDMPVVLKPTGSFGMGLHSVFMITDEMQIKTKSEEDKAYEISFIPRRKNGYISVKENHDRKNVGTEISVSIKESKLRKATEDLESQVTARNFSMIIKYGRLINREQFKSYDCLSDRYSIDTNLRGLSEYIYKYTKNIKMFSVSCILDKKPLDDFRIIKEKQNKSIASKNGIKREREIFRDENYNEEGLKYHIYFDIDGVLICEASDKNNSTIMTLSTRKDFKIYDEGKTCILSRESYLGETYFKEILCENIFINEYFDIKMSVFKGEAKEVLDVARDELKSKIHEEYFKRIDFVIEDYLNTLHKHLGKICNMNDDIKNSEWFERSMFVIRLAYKKYLSVTLRYNWGDDFLIESYFKTEKGNVENLGNFMREDMIKYKEFIEAEEIFFYKSYFISGNTLKEWINESNSNYTVAISNLHFDKEYVYKNFKIAKCKIIGKYNEDNKDTPMNFILKKYEQDSEKCFFVNKESDEYKAIMTKLVSKDSVRNAIYPIKCDEKSSEVECLVVDKLPENSNIGIRLEFRKYFIISPLINTADIKYLDKNINDLMDWLKKEASFDRLVQFVATNSVRNKISKVTVEEVEKAYRQLIKDYLDIIKEEAEKAQEEEEKAKETVKTKEEKAEIVSFPDSESTKGNAQPKEED